MDFFLMEADVVFLAETGGVFAAEVAFLRAPVFGAGALAVILLFTASALALTGESLLFEGGVFFTLFSAVSLDVFDAAVLAFALGEPFAGRTFPSDLADLDWGIMELDPVVAEVSGGFSEKWG